MTVAQRVRSLRLMEKMEKAYQRGNSSITKADDGTLEYRDQNNDVLFTAKMERRS